MLFASELRVVVNVTDDGELAMLRSKLPSELDSKVLSFDNCKRRILRVLSPSTFIHITMVKLVGSINVFS